MIKNVSFNLRSLLLLSWGMKGQREGGGRREGGWGREKKIGVMRQGTVNNLIHRLWRDMRWSFFVYWRKCRCCLSPPYSPYSGSQFCPHFTLSTPLTRLLPCTRWRSFFLSKSGWCDVGNRHWNQIRLMVSVTDEWSVNTYEFLVPLFDRVLKVNSTLPLFAQEWRRQNDILKLQQPLLNHTTFSNLSLQEKETCARDLPTLLLLFLTWH